jgi:hypothetical protein
MAAKDPSIDAQRKNDEEELDKLLEEAARIGQKLGYEKLDKSRMKITFFGAEKEK